MIKDYYVLLFAKYVSVFSFKHVLLHDKCHSDCLGQLLWTCIVFVVWFARVGLWLHSDSGRRLRANLIGYRFAVVNLIRHRNHMITFCGETRMLADNCDPSMRLDLYFGVLSNSS